MSIMSQSRDSFALRCILMSLNFEISTDSGSNPFPLSGVN